MDGGILANRNSTNHPFFFPSQSERSPDSGFFCMWSVEELYYALLPKTDLTEIKGEGMIAGYCHININDSPIVLYTVLKLIHVIWDLPLLEGLTARISHPASGTSLFLQVSRGASGASFWQSSLMPAMATLAFGHLFMGLHSGHGGRLQPEFSGKECLNRIWYIFFSNSRFTKAARQILPWDPAILHPAKNGNKIVLTLTWFV